MNRDKLDYVLVCVDNATMELECVEIMDLPNDLQQDFIEAHALLSHIRTVLDLEMRLEMDEDYD